MYELNSNEKLTPAMFYTAEALFHGEVVTTDLTRVNIWLRSDSAPKYIHLLNAQMISLTGSRQTLKLDEAFLPTDEVIAYHVAPGVEIQMDYEEDEPNRHMVPTQVISPSFIIFQGDNRISTQTDFGTTLEVGRTAWLSFYNVTVSTPNMPKMSLKAEMVLLRPESFIFRPMG